MAARLTLPASVRSWIAATALWAAAGLAFAIVVTAEQVAQAIANSPLANAMLRNNASVVGALAMFESGGQTTVYNGSCCYGVLQMSTTNILAAGYTPAQYRALPLQAQVDAWAGMQSQALNANVVSQLQSMGTFDGQTVDFPFLLACVQLGQGNCAAMVASGRCSGFADSNGTTICGMAATTRNNLGLPSTPGNPSNPGGGGTTPPSAGGGSTWTPTIPPFSYGSTSEAFEGAAGANPGQVLALVRGALGGTLILLVAVALIHHFRSYTAGEMDMFSYFHENKRVVILMVLFMLVFVQ